MLNSAESGRLAPHFPTSRHCHQLPTRARSSEAGTRKAEHMCYQDTCTCTNAPKAKHWYDHMLDIYEDGPESD